MQLKKASPPRISTKKVFDLDSVNYDEGSNRIERQNNYKKAKI